MSKSPIASSSFLLKNNFCCTALRLLGAPLGTDLGHWELFWTLWLLYHFKVPYQLPMLGLKMKLHSVRQRRFHKLVSSLIRILNFKFKLRKKVVTLDHLNKFYVPFVPCTPWIHVNDYNIGIYRQDCYSCLSFSIFKTL